MTNIFSLANRYNEYIQTNSDTSNLWLYQDCDDIGLKEVSLWKRWFVSPFISSYRFVPLAERVHRLFHEGLAKVKSGTVSEEQVEKMKSFASWYERRVTAYQNVQQCSVFLKFWRKIWGRLYGSTQVERLFLLPQRTFFVEKMIDKFFTQYASSPFREVNKSKLIESDSSHEQFIKGLNEANGCLDKEAAKNTDKMTKRWLVNGEGVKFRFVKKNDKNVIRARQLFAEGGFKRLFRLAIRSPDGLWREESIRAYAKVVEGKPSETLKKEYNISNLLCQKGVSVVQMKKIFKEKDRLKLKGLLMGLYRRGDMKKYLTSSTYNEKERLDMAQQICANLEGAHRKDEKLARVVFLDLKPENILLGEGNKIVFVDFGLAQVLHGETRKTKFDGTVVYAAPEMIESLRTDESVYLDFSMDMWSFGLLLLELIHGPKANAFDRLEGNIDVAEAGFFVNLYDKIKNVKSTQHFENFLKQQIVADEKVSDILKSKQCSKDFLEDIVLTDQQVCAVLKDECSFVQFLREKILTDKKVRARPYNEIFHYLQENLHPVNSLIEGLLLMDPSKRPTAAEARADLDQIIGELKKS